MFLILAVIAFVLAALGVGLGAISVGWLGLAFLALGLLIPWSPFPSRA